MLKSLKQLMAWFSAPSEEMDSRTDPLSHPLIARMTSRELADLPLPSPLRQAGRDKCCPA
jgi:hypothetical protein